MRRRSRTSPRKKSRRTCRPRAPATPVRAGTARSRRGPGRPAPPPAGRRSAGTARNRCCPPRRSPARDVRSGTRADGERRPGCGRRLSRSSVRKSVRLATERVPARICARSGTVLSGSPAARQCRTIRYRSDERTPGTASTIASAPLRRAASTTSATGPATGTPRMVVSCLSGSSSRIRTGQYSPWSRSSRARMVRRPAAPAPTTITLHRPDAPNVDQQFVTQPEGEARPDHQEQGDPQIDDQHAARAGPGVEQRWSPPRSAGNRAPPPPSPAARPGSRHSATTRGAVRTAGTESAAAAPPGPSEASHQARPDVVLGDHRQLEADHARRRPGEGGHQRAERQGDGQAVGTQEAARGAVRPGNDRGRCAGRDR